MLDPDSLGFTKQGSPNWATTLSILSASQVSLGVHSTDRATGIPASRNSAVVHPL